MTKKNIVAEFGAREGTYRAALLLALASNYRKQVPFDVLVKRTYGVANAEYKHAVKMSIRGAKQMIKSAKLKYNIKQDAAGCGLYPR